MGERGQNKWKITNSRETGSREKVGTLYAFALVYLVSESKFCLLAFPSLKKSENVDLLFVCLAKDKLEDMDVSLNFLT